MKSVVLKCISLPQLEQKAAVSSSMSEVLNSQPKSIRSRGILEVAFFSQKVLDTLQCDIDDMVRIESSWGTSDSGSCLLLRAQVLDVALLTCSQMV